VTANGCRGRIGSRRAVSDRWTGLRRSSARLRVLRFPLPDDTCASARSSVHGRQRPRARSRSCPQRGADLSVPARRGGRVGRNVSRRWESVLWRAKYSSHVWTGRVIEDDTAAKAIGSRKGVAPVSGTSLWPVDCQTCGQPLGVAPPVLFLTTLARRLCELASPQLPRAPLERRHHGGNVPGGQLPSWSARTLNLPMKEDNSAPLTNTVRSCWSIPAWR
jgi:hypothetical protein